MSREHFCPHGGRLVQTVAFHGETAESIVLCGDAGFLCPACREDRADARTRQLVEGLALAGLLANPNTAKLSADDIESGAPRTAARMAAALRERKGGE